MKHKRYEKLGEDIYSGELRSGLRINVVTKPGFRHGFAVLAANYGGAHRRFSLGGTAHDTPAGVAHFLEHKMFDMPDGDNALATLAANGAQPNAFTSSGMTAYYFGCTEGFEENLRMLIKFVSTPYFTDETVAKEQGIIGQEICMVEDDPGYVIYNRLMRMLYAHHPIRDQVAGSIESIAQISAQTLYDCHRAFYAPSNMTLCVAADCDPERIFGIADKLLTHERQETPKADMGESETEYPHESFCEERMEVSAPQFFIGAKLTPAPDGDALLRQKLVSQLALRTLLGQSGDFYSSLYADGTLGRNFGYETDYAAGTATIIIHGQSEAPRKVLAELKGAVKGVAEHGLDPDAFDAAKKAMFGSELMALEHFDALCFALVEGQFGGYCALDSFEVLESIKKAECEEFISTHLSPDRLAMSIISPVKAQ